ncbi:hypothetical protein KTO58_28040 [Chitinophaga pendula]|uniref:hypothetical protein n=1 Tax=Chitinophaga TaxID=79328 RepID=UPI000BB02729|nr:MULTISPECIES: hypothetical protein [Chitinophaga]ASZ09599.1 hypothetical protein CK934_00710 [Chitinophaga sp. MD30]UCJ07466.1 hypothetical protein KTO58_28040 [Chitinophaga pendula]
MKTILCIFLMLNAIMIYSQNRVFIKAPNLTDTLADENIKKIKMPWGRLARNVLVIYKDGTKAHFQKRSIWGFEKPNKEIIRFYEGDTFELVDTAVVIIYKTWSRRPVFYFSEFIYSDVKLFSKKKIIKVLGNYKFELLYKKSNLVRKLCEYY